MPPVVQRERVRSVRLKSGAAQAGSPAAKRMLRDRRGRDFFQAVILYEIQKYSKILNKSLVINGVEILTVKC